MKSPLSRIVSLILGAALAVSAVVATSAPSSAAPRLIEDANLEACILQSMASDEFSPITPGVIVQQDLDNFVVHHANEVWIYSIRCDNVSTLEGLQFFQDPKLYGLDIYDSTFTDLTPAAALPGLTSLVVSNGLISDLSPLSTMTKLDFLDLSGNQIQDISALKPLVNLEFLMLHGNRIADITALAGMRALQYLGFSGNQIVDLTPLKALVNLKDLQASENQISSVAALAGMTELRAVWLDNNQITSLVGLEACNKLEYLILEGNKITGVTQLAGKTELMDLYLSDNEIANLTGLEGLTRLRNLQLTNNKITDLTPLTGLTRLFSLFLEHNQISNLAPLSALPTLFTLQLDFNTISNIGPLGEIERLDHLTLSNNRIKDVSPLAKLERLDYVALDNNLISDISPIADLLNNAYFLEPDQGWTNKKFWSLDRNQIMDLSSLDWDKIAPLWEDGSYHYFDFIRNYDKSGYSVNNQTLIPTDKPEVGSTWALPKVKPATNSPSPITWSVTGGATINAAAGTVTFKSAGTVTLSWTDDQFTIPCPEDLPELCTEDADVTFFSGSMKLTVVDPDAPDPGPIVAETNVVIDASVKSPTGGTARLANGTDSYTLIITLSDADGKALPGYKNDLSMDAQAALKVSSIVANANGTYTVTVTSSTPGNFDVAVLFDGDPIGDPVAMNFLKAVVTLPILAPGFEQTATALGFLAGERVTVTVNSAPINLGSFTATGAGVVVATFTAPLDFDAGRHNVTFVGARSGTVVVGFEVPMAPCCGPPDPGPGPNPGPAPKPGPKPAPKPGPDAPTGGTSIPSGSLPLYALVIMSGAALFSAAMIRRERS
ncbi:MAG: leucine-rich repeat domain-containing protein [Propionibacteriaceae bacterium]|nr:leucine-rich repeat domain-containing protein [Propionibacteriaceae bacterium]